MGTLRTIASCWIVVVLVVLASAGGAAGQVWAPAASGTSQTITAIEYLGAGKLWYTTAGGQIARQLPGGFDIFTPAVPVSFRDIEMAPASQMVGLAAGTAGDLYRTADGGDNWTKIAGVETLGWEFPVSAAPCKLYGGSTQLGDISRVKFARDGKVAFLFAEGAEILHSDGLPGAGESVANVGAEGTWERTNPIDPVNGQCKFKGEFEDAFFTAGDPGIGWLAGTTTLKTFNALSTAAIQPVVACSGEGCRLAVDPANTQRQFALHGGYLYASTNAWTAAPRTYLAPRNNDQRAQAPLRDMAFAAGTLIAAGDLGNIDVTTDGVNLYHQFPPPTSDGVNFKAVDGYDSTHFAVGGEGGALMLTTQANYIPPRPSALPSAPPPPAAQAKPVARFTTSPKSLRVSRTGRFTYRFVATPKSSGKIRLKSVKKVKIGKSRKYMVLASRPFTASATGSVQLKYKLSRANLKALKRSTSLRFTVTVTLAGQTFKTRLRLKPPRPAARQ